MSDYQQGFDNYGAIFDYSVVIIGITFHDILNNHTHTYKVEASFIDFRIKLVFFRWATQYVLVCVRPSL